MSLEFYRWFCRDVLRLSDREARHEANYRELRRRMDLKKARAKSAGNQKPTGLADGHEQKELIADGDGDITVYPEVRSDVS